MILARRKFIASSLFFTASALLLGNAHSGFARTLLDDSQLPKEVLSDPLYGFTRETFEPYVGGYFEAVGARDEKIALKLVSVDSYTPNSQTKISTRAPLSTESFSLTFNADKALPSSTSIHQIKHGALGDFNLFLTRRDGPRGEISYEAVFNRLR